MSGTVNISGGFGARGFATPIYLLHGMAQSLGNWIAVPFTAYYTITVLLRANAAITDFLDITVGQVDTGGTFTRLANPEAVGGAGAYTVLLTDTIPMTAGYGYGIYAATGGSSIPMVTANSTLTIVYAGE
jgi:hypothetical protein